MRKIEAKVTRAKTRLNQFLSNEVAELQLDGGSWPLSRLLRAAGLNVGDRVVIVAADEYVECEKLARELAKIKEKKNVKRAT